MHSIGIDEIKKEQLSLLFSFLNYTSSVATAEATRPSTSTTTRIRQMVFFIFDAPP